MKGWLVCPALLVGLQVGPAEAQDTQAVFDPKTAYVASVAYTDASSHLLTGRAPDRRIFALSGSYARRFAREKHFSYRWEIEVKPLVLVRNPRQVDNITVAINGAAPSTLQSNTLVLNPCPSERFSGVLYGLGPTGLVPDGTYSFVQTCSQKWVYSGGVSPLGQRFSFRPGRQIQPYFPINAGFLASVRTIPVTGATKFNFTGHFGPGVEWFVKPKQSITVDLQYNHISNAGRARDDVNYGIDNILLRASYRFGR